MYVLCACLGLDGRIVLGRHLKRITTPYETTTRWRDLAEKLKKVVGGLGMEYLHVPIDFCIQPRHKPAVQNRASMCVNHLQA